MPNKPKNRLRLWCEANGIKYETAKSYRHKHGLTIQQTIDFYAHRKPTLMARCKAAGLSYSTVESFKRRHKLTDDEVIDKYLSTRKRNKPAAQVAADKYGVCVKKVYYRISRDGCSAESAARDVAEQMGLLADRPAALPIRVHPILTRAWV